MNEDEEKGGGTEEQVALVTIDCMLHAIVGQSRLEAASALAIEAGLGENAFNIPLSPTGLTPITHWGASSGVSFASYDEMVTGLNNGNFPGHRYYQIDIDTQLLEATNSPTSPSPLGRRWPWSATMKDNGLKRVN